MQAYKIAQLGLAYAQSLWSFHTGGTPHPFSASFVVSNKCNIRCSYCNFPHIVHTDLTLNEIEVIFSRLKKMGVVRLGILGGEPLYRKDIIDILGIGKDMGFAISMNTNLLLYDKYKDQLDAVDYFFTSLDGDKETHTKNRGNHAYHKIIESIDDIVGRNKKITAICVVTEGTQPATIDYLLNLGKEKKFTVHFQPECYDAEYTPRSATAAMNQEETRSLWKHLIMRKRQGYPVFSSLPYLEYISNWQDYRLSAIYDPQQRCAAGNTFFFVDATGDAYPCAYTKGMTGGVNLLRDDWQRFFTLSTPCTRCIVGPMLEFNLISKNPLPSIVNALKNI